MRSASLAPIDCLKPTVTWSLETGALQVDFDSDTCSGCAQRERTVGQVAGIGVRQRRVAGGRDHVRRRRRRVLARDARGEGAEARRAAQRQRERRRHRAADAAGLVADLAERDAVQEVRRDLGGRERVRRGRSSLSAATPAAVASVGAAPVKTSTSKSARSRARLWERRWRVAGGRRRGRRCGRRGRLGLCHRGLRVASRQPEAREPMRAQARR